MIGVGIGTPFNSKAKRTIVLDRFNRADSSTSLGNADTGQTWTATPNPWGITSNQAYSVNTSTTDLVFIDAGVSDAKVSTKITFSVNEGVMFRYTDSNNQFFSRISSTGLGLFRNNAGTPTSLGSYSFSPVVGNVYSVMVICSNSSIRVFLDGVERITVTDTFNQTATKYGLRASTSTAGRFDDFYVEAAT